MKRSPPVRTHGLRHIALAVRDPQHSLRFYQAVLGVIPGYELPTSVDPPGRARA